MAQKQSGQQGKRSQGGQSGSQSKKQAGKQNIEERESSSKGSSK